MNRTMTVSQLSSYLKEVFDDEELLHDITLSGEVADISYSDKHTYLTLADGECSIQCVHFYSRDKVDKGARLALRGSVRFYGKRSAVSFCYTELFACGEGDKNAKLNALRKKLEGLGYFENRPLLPKYIAEVIAITSPDGAAIHDLVRVVRDKAPFVRIRVYPVKVQGEGSARQMAEAVKTLQSYNADALVLCRGGGSDEDLDSFNDEALATAVALSRIPVISAVGHEIDYTLCDCCAGTRAGTPSIAGGIISERACALVNDLYGAVERGMIALDKKLDARKNALEKACADVTHAVCGCVERKKHGLELTAYQSYHMLEKKLVVQKGGARSAADRLRAAADTLIAKNKNEAERLSSLMRALDPRRKIKAGYAAVLSRGKSVSGAADIKAGDEISLIFADGTATALVRTVGGKEE